jgi:nicotinamidase-related amidase
MPHHGARPGIIPSRLTARAVTGPLRATNHRRFLDKFLNSDLEKTPKERGITTVIMTGLVFHGAILFTSSEAAQKGFSVVIPVDAITAITPYAEQFSVWQFGNAPIISTKITLTKSDMIKF